MSTAPQQTDRPPAAVRYAVMGMRFFCRKRLTLPICFIRVEWAPESEIGAKGDARIIGEDMWGSSVSIRIAATLSPRAAAHVCAHELRHIHQALNGQVEPDVFRGSGETDALEEDAARFAAEALRLYEEAHGPLDGE